MKNFILNFLNDLKRNYKTLILAFLLSFTLWIVVSIQVFPTIEKEINNVSVEAHLTDYMIRNNLQIVNDVNQTVNIKIQGKRYDISRLDTQDFYASVDLSEVTSAGKYNVALEVFAKTNEDYTLLEVEPKTLSLEIDKIITKEFPITGTAPDISLPEGFYADDVTTSPETISVTGSASMLDKIERIEAKSTFHGEIMESTQTNSEIIIYGSNGTKIVSDKLKLSTELVTVNIPIFKQKELPLKVTINYPAGFDAESLKYEIRPELITVAAPNNTIDNQSQLDIGTINLSDITPNSNTYLPIVLPEGYKNLSGNNSATITWKTENYGLLDYTVTSENIEIKGIPDNYKVSLTTTALNVTVTGPSDLITGFSKGDITATVNLMGVTLRPGTQDVTATVSIKGTGQKCWVTGDYKVTIYAVQKDEGAY
ncbi:MAG: CdaR family protein [Oscillospiraceae bacterium]|nr:CdaR family protein [Oscillospiraceae bacterium]